MESEGRNINLLKQTNIFFFYDYSNARFKLDNLGMFMAR